MTAEVDAVSFMVQIVRMCMYNCEGVTSVMSEGK